MSIEGSPEPLSNGSPLEVARQAVSGKVRKREGPNYILQFFEGISESGTSSKIQDERPRARIGLPGWLP